MCRMMAVMAPNPLDAQRILGGLRAQAKESVNGPPNDRTHPHGWGLIAATPGRVRYLGRQPTNMATDPGYLRALDLVPQQAPDTFFIAHARNASIGSIKLENTHPFLWSGWAFAHNGTIREPERLEDPNTAYRGATDSERFFHRFLREAKASGSMTTGLRRTVRHIESQHSFSSLTCLFTDGTTLYGYRRVGDDVSECGTEECQRAYYTLGVGHVGDALIIAQEPGHLGRVTGWKEVPDDSLVVVRRGEDPRIVPLESTPEPNQVNIAKM